MKPHMRHYRGNTLRELYKAAIEALRQVYALGYNDASIKAASREDAVVKSYQEALNSIVKDDGEWVPLNVYYPEIGKPVRMRRTGNPRFTTWEIWRPKT